MSKRKNAISPIYFEPLTAIENPISFLREPGDEFSVKVTKRGDLVAKLHAGGVKRSALKYKTGKTVCITSA